MARVQDKKIVWRCYMHCLVEEPPSSKELNSPGGPRCEKHNAELRPRAWLPGLLCDTCGDISVDQGGGTMCEGRFLDRPHKPHGKRLVWLLATVQATPRPSLPDYPPAVEDT